MPAAHEPPTGRQAVEPKRAHKINGDRLDLNGARLDGRAGIGYAGSALAPKDREGHRSHTLSPRRAIRTARLRAETR
jgi:hypothetical protein